MRVALYLAMARTEVARHVSFYGDVAVAYTMGMAARMSAATCSFSPSD